VPVWAVVTLIVGLVLLIGAVAAAVWLGWRAYERRQLLRLIGRLESLEAVSQALVEAIGRLSRFADDELEAFAADTDAPERRVLAEVRSRAQLLQDELDHMPLPRRLTPVAEALADAAFVVAREAGLITDDDVGEQALDRLASLDLSAVDAYTAQARTRLAAMCAVCGLEETAVYGGGLYL